MGNAVFPSLTNLPGLGLPVVKRPAWTTVVQRAISGFERRTALMAYPLWNFELTFEVLRSGNIGGISFTEYQRLVDFINSRQGMYDSFLYDDPEDDAVTDFQFGIGDAVKTAFQLTRSLFAGGFVEPVQNLNPASTVTNIKDNGSVVNPANYTVSATGLITFTTPPAAGHTLTWTGAYYYRVRFDMDEADFSRFLYKRWELKKLTFVGSVVNKV